MEKPKTPYPSQIAEFGLCQVLIDNLIRVTHHCVKCLTLFRCIHCVVQYFAAISKIF